MKDDGFSVVSKKQAREVPYPYILVNDDGTFRELTDSEKEYLQTKFHGGDGNRPYVKHKYSSKAPDGKMGGFLERKKLPKDTKPGRPASSKQWWTPI